MGGHQEYEGQKTYRDSHGVRGVSTMPELAIRKGWNSCPSV